MAFFSFSHQIRIEAKEVNEKTSSSFFLLTETFPFEEFFQRERSKTSISCFTDPTQRTIRCSKVYSNRYRAKKTSPKSIQFSIELFFVIIFNLLDQPSPAPSIPPRRFRTVGTNTDARAPNQNMPVPLPIQNLHRAFQHLNTAPPLVTSPTSGSRPKVVYTTLQVPKAHSSPPPLPPRKGKANSSTSSESFSRDDFSAQRRDCQTTTLEVCFFTSSFFPYHCEH